MCEKLLKIIGLLNPWLHREKWTFNTFLTRTQKLLPHKSV